MRFEQLRLTAVGPFTQYQLDLTGGRQGLHLIYGDNEAGKSSTLRALRYLLFGFPARLDDDFLHPYNALRVGARLVNDRGEVLDITRRKAKLKSLRDANDDQPVDESRLRQFTGNVTADLFARAFAIDHPTLVRGGEEIVRGEGDLAQMLLAGSGVAGLRDVERGLEDEAKELFVPRGRNQAIHRLLGELSRARGEVRTHQLSAAQWQRYRKSLERLDRQKRDIETRQHEARTQYERLRRLADAVPLAERYQQCLASAEMLGDVILLPADFDRRRERLLQELHVAKARHASAVQETQTRRKQRDQLDVPNQVLQRGPEIEQLEKRWHRFHDSQADRPIVAGSLQAVEDRMRSTLRELGRVAEVERVDQMLLPAAERSRIRQLAGEYQILATRRREGSEALARLTEELEQKRREFDALPAACNAAELEQAIRLAMRDGDLDQQLARQRQQLAVLETELSDALARLPGWSGTIEALNRLAVPVPETVDRFAQHLGEVDRELQSLVERQREYMRELEELDQQITQLGGGDSVPTEEMLRAARTARDRLWALLRRRLDGQSVDTDTWASAVDQHETEPADPVDAYEARVRRSDDLADRLRREADRVARYAQLSSRRVHLQEAIVQLAEDVRQQRQSVQRIDQQWQALWQPLDIEPGSPAEMAAWLDRHAAIVDLVRRLRELRAGVEDVWEKRERHAERIRQAIGSVGEPPSDDAVAARDASLTAILDRAERVLERIRACNAQRTQLARDIQRLEHEVRRRQAAVAETEQQWSAWQEAWNSATSSLPTDWAVGPGEAEEVLERLQQLAQDVELAEKERGRLREIDAFAQQFRADVRVLAEHVFGDRPPEASEEKLAVAIVARWREAQETEKEAQRLDDELRQRREEAEVAAASVRRCSSELDGLCAEAGCQEISRLEDAWTQSCRRREVERQLAALREQLVALAGPVELPTFVEQVRAADPETLQAQIDQHRGELEDLRAELGQVMTSIGKEQVILQQMDASGEAAAAMEAARDSLAGLETAVRQFATWKLAVHCLRHGLARYRERHQGTMLTTAGRVFARLTTGRFSGLRVDYDHDGQPRLMGTRAPDDQAVPVSGMSDGTADQLYFALRYAWLDEYLGEHESLPLVVDDILIRFDDARAQETLRLLGELSARTQVLFFTHHRHLTTLAREVLDEQTLYIHQLAADRQACGAPSG